MKILHAIRSLDPAHGGPAEGVRQLASEARKLGHEVEVVSLDDPGAPFLNLGDSTVHPMGPGTGTYSYTKLFLPWMKTNCRRFDIVVIDGLWQYHSLGSWIAVSKMGVPYAVFTHGMLDPWFKRRYPLKHLKKLVYWTFADYRVVRDAQAVLFTSEEERLRARQSFSLYNAREVVVTFGTSNPPTEVGMQDAEVRYRFPEITGKRIALVLGRIHPKKGCDIALQAFAAKLSKDRRWQLVVAGPDQCGWVSKLKELAVNLGISSQVTWAGSVSGALKWGLLRRAEIFLLPSHQENFGIAVAESLACGVPVMISDKVNIWREVEKGCAGLVSPDDVSGLSGSLAKWIAFPPETAAQMRERARQCFVQNFEIGLASRSVLNALAEAIAIHGLEGRDRPLPEPSCSATAKN